MSSAHEFPVTIIKPPSGFEAFDLAELRRYRDLLYFLVLRDIKVLYAQTILGFAWAILNPAVQIVLFTFIFGRVAALPTDGTPYLLFSTVAIIPWAYMSDAMTSSSQSLVAGQQMLAKIYFPRIIFPLTPVIAKMLDFIVSLVILLATMIYYRVAPTWNMLYAPIFVVLMMCIPASIGLWLSALAIRFRDVRFAMLHVIRLLIYTAPILYSASSIPPTYRFVYSLNPIVAVIEGYRSAFLGTPMQWEFIVPGAVVAIVLLLTGAVYFRRMERVFVDVS